MLVEHKVGNLGLRCVGGVAVDRHLKRAHRCMAQQRHAVVAPAPAVDISCVEVPDAHVGREAEDMSVVLPRRAHGRIGTAKEAEDGCVVDKPSATDHHECAAVVGPAIWADLAHRQAEREVKSVVAVLVYRRACNEIVLPIERERQFEGIGR